jgi:hypothetical protein
MQFAEVTPRQRLIGIDLIQRGETHMARDIFDRYSRAIAIAVASSNRFMMDIIIGARVHSSLIERATG